MSGAWGINNSGQIVGYSYDSSGNDHPFLYSGSGTMQDLNNLIPASSGWTLISTTDVEANPPRRMINTNGQIVCLGKNGLGQSHALLLSPLPTQVRYVASAKNASTNNASAAQGGPSVFANPSGIFQATMPIADKPAQTAALQSGASEVMKLFRHGTPADIIAAYVTNSPLSLSLSADDILFLSQQGVPAPVITAMIERQSELQRQTSKAATAPAPARQKQ